MKKGLIFLGIACACLGQSGLITKPTLPEACATVIRLAATASARDPRATDPIALASHIRKPDLVDVLRERDYAGTEVHLVGISGAGMFPIAQWLATKGVCVSGCDKSPSDIGRRLLQIGTSVEIGHDHTHVANAAAVVHTAAVPADHPELVAAREAGIPVFSRAEALGAIVNSGRLVGVSGTHGKTTTTAMTTLILEAAALSPTAFVGGVVPGWDGGLRLGSGQIMVAEADEFNRSFLQLRPRVVIITNVEAEHMEIYGTVEAIKAAFAKFIEPVPADGLIAACIDDPGAAELYERAPADRRISYGLAPAARLRAIDLVPSGTGTRFTVTLDGQVLGQLELAVPGEHNVRNALGAFAAARHLGADFAAAKTALATFTGVARRFEILGDARGITFVDDYGHHPTEVRATLDAARARYPGRRIVAVLQPHLYSRAQQFAPEFGQVLTRADVVFVTDIYGSREAPIAGVTGEIIFDSAKAAGAREVYYTPTVAELPDRLASFLRPGDVLITLGAGDVTQVGRTLVQRLRIPH